MFCHVSFRVSVASEPFFFHNHHTKASESSSSHSKSSAANAHKLVPDSILDSRSQNTFMKLVSFILVSHILVWNLYHTFFHETCIIHSPKSIHSSTCIRRLQNSYSLLSLFLVEKHLILFFHFISAENISAEKITTEKNHHQKDHRKDHRKDHC